MKILAKALRYLFLSTCVLTIGCKSKTHNDYAFRRVELPYEWGSLHVALLGKEKAVDDSVSMRGSPYELLVWARLKKDFIDLEIEDACFELFFIKLANYDNQQIIFESKGFKQIFIRGYQGGYEATFSFDELDLDYQDYKLNFEFSVNKCKAESSKMPVSVTIERDYKQQTITLWDKLMGI